MLFFFFKQKTAYDMRISDWSSDVCSSDLAQAQYYGGYGYRDGYRGDRWDDRRWDDRRWDDRRWDGRRDWRHDDRRYWRGDRRSWRGHYRQRCWTERSEEHTSELQSLMRLSYAVF